MIFCLYNVFGCKVTNVFSIEQHKWGGQFAKGFCLLYKQKRFLEVDNFSFYDKNSVKESVFLVSLQPKS